jgi:hypothetical protein
MTGPVSLGLLLLRFAVGVVFIAHGYNHIFGGGKIEGTGRWFNSLGMRPGILHAWVASLTELGAGALLLFMGLFVLRMGFAQKSLAEQAAKWPVTAGRIDASGLQALRSHSGYRRWRTVFKSRIVYSYGVDGQRYSADRVTFGATVTASLTGLVGGKARQYVEGSKVDVHYDPANPASAVLECRVRGQWLLWVCSAGFLGGAAFLVGLF